MSFNKQCILPAELNRHIILNLPCYEILSKILVCKQWQHIIELTGFWKDVILNQWKSYITIADKIYIDNSVSTHNKSYDIVREWMSHPIIEFDHLFGFTDNGYTVLSDKLCKNFSILYRYVYNWSIQFSTFSNIGRFFLMVSNKDHELLISDPIAKYHVEIYIDAKIKGDITRTVAIEEFHKRFSVDYNYTLDNNSCFDEWLYQYGDGNYSVLGNESTYDDLRNSWLEIHGNNTKESEFGQVWIKELESINMIDSIRTVHVSGMGGEEYWLYGATNDEMLYIGYSCYDTY